MTTQSGFQLYDTTLRDGAQSVALTLSVNDKLSIARSLDRLGVGFIEGGWPGAIPKDTEFFRRAAGELHLQQATLTAFGATRPPGGAAERDPQIASLLEAGTEVVTLVAKSHPRQVRTALHTTLGENLAMIADSVGHLVGSGRRVFLDAEHFFDGYLCDPGYALEVLDVATAHGAEVVVLCDTNGGMLPDQIHAIVSACAAQTETRLGIHCHDDSGCAVANTLAAVDAGARHAQVTANGYGERCGNADLFSVAANLALKRGVDALPADRLADLSEVAERIGVVAGTGVLAGAPYVGSAAFAHKAGLHASALRLDPALYQHIEPDRVGNSSRTVISEMAGRASIELKAGQLGYSVPAGSAAAGRVAQHVKQRESEGCEFAAADASFELLLAEELYGHAYAYPFELLRWEVTTHHPSGTGGPDTCATVTIGRGTTSAVAESVAGGPLEAVFAAVSAAVRRLFPHSAGSTLVDYAVRQLPAGGAGAAGRVRVLVTLSDGKQTWRSVGVATHLLGAFVRAAYEGLSFELMSVSGSGRTSSQLKTNVMGEVA